MKRNFIFYLFIILSMLTFSSVNAEVSIDLTTTDEGADLPGDRQLIFGTESTNFQILNSEGKSKFYAYAKKGETIYFGTSMENSYKGYEVSVTGIKVSTFGTNKEEKIAYNSSFVSTYKVASKKGLIENREQEKNGPNYGSVSNGYNPFSFVAPEDGVYEFKFYALKKHGDLSGLPKTQITGGDFSGQEKGGVIGSIDITVVSNGKKIDGRVWSYSLLFRSENNIYSKLYVLTDDGYTYLVDSNGSRPYTGALIANKRGLIDLNTNKSRYNSYYHDNIFGANLGKEKLALHIAREESDDYDSVYKMFYNAPSNDLPENIKHKVVDKIEFYFKGDTTEKENSIINGKGGYFYIKYMNVDKATLTLDFSKYKTTLEDSSSIELKNREFEITFDDVKEGEYKKVYWDGLDGNGKAVPLGTYGDESNAFATITTKISETHFPFIDVEVNKNGIIIHNLTTDDYTVYSDNSGTPLESVLDGVSSKDGVLKATANESDNMIVDIWSYVVLKEKMSNLAVIEEEIVEKDDEKQPPTEKPNIVNPNTADIENPDTGLFVPQGIVIAGIVTVIMSSIIYIKLRNKKYL